MGSAAQDAIEALLVDARFDAAFRAIVATNADVSDDDALRRLAAAVCALAGRERALAGISGLGILDCRNFPDVDAWCATLDCASSSDYLIASIVLSWTGDRQAVYGVLRKAHDLAEQERRHHIAVAARERLAHHALLFGDLETARASLEAALTLASAHRLERWRIVCAARLAQLSLDADDLERAAALFGEVRALQLPSEARTLFAPTAVRLAVLRGDAAAAQKWASAETYALALDSQDAGVALDATVTCILAADAHPLSLMLSRALRRGLILVDNPSNSIEFLALAARMGEPEEARLAAELLRAVFVDAEFDPSDNLWLFSGLGGEISELVAPLRRSSVAAVIIPFGAPGTKTASYGLMQGRFDVSSNLYIYAASATNAQLFKTGFPYAKPPSPTGLNVMQADFVDSSQYLPTDPVPASLILGQYFGPLASPPPQRPPPLPVNALAQFAQPLNPVTGLFPNATVRDIVGALVADPPELLFFTLDASDGDLRAFGLPLTPHAKPKLILRCLAGRANCDGKPEHLFLAP
jgi:hypothetical protein